MTSNSPKQQLALDMVDSGEPRIFITGGGGRGKSYVINQIVNKYYGETVVCAPSGSAAQLVGGMTAHKMFGLPIGMSEDTEYIKHSKEFIKIFGNKVVKRVVIDEISMLRVDNLTRIDKLLRSIRDRSKPFGGLQIIGVGDFLQLGPIVGYSEVEVFYERYDSPFAFTSESWDFKSIVLDINHRTHNPRQNRILDSIRSKDKHYKRAVDVINKESAPYAEGEFVQHLCCYKEDANGINRYWYSKIQSKEVLYEAEMEGTFNKEEIPVEPKLKLKVGTRVIIKASDYNQTYVNGDMGTVKGLASNCVVVMLDSGVKVFVTVNTWEKYSYSSKGGKLTKEVVASYTQMPVKLAYAITIHSSQGQTLDKVAIHLGKGCFSSGQAYTALSRVKDLTNISFVTPLRYSDIVVSDEVLEFYNNLEEISCE